MTALSSPLRTLRRAGNEAVSRAAPYVLGLVDHLLAHSAAFIETGTGRLASHVAGTYPQMPIHTCEESQGTPGRGIQDGVDRGPAHRSPRTSPGFLGRLHEAFPQLRQQTNLYWLGAHASGFGRSPLREEVAYITRAVPRAFIAIDDFLVPDRPDLDFGVDHRCARSMEYVFPAIPPGRTYYLVYPTYAPSASAAHRPRGTALLLYGLDDFPWPDHLARHFQVYAFTK
jgi:hypothetical protein